ncbi:hypothetical protein [Pseudomonas sp. S11A4]|uniref:hypothetical protein n=1 Tax=Pseudomonas sp. S11A4 TaxID=1476791 RepID=UPI00215C649F|nr:hypothetical protein [Pseudomonas sp. S11A4]MCR8935733.1 hypothetical protein [Pseudomonas sp. S11A4]
MPHRLAADAVAVALAPKASSRWRRFWFSGPLFAERIRAVVQVLSVPRVTGEAGASKTTLLTFL